MQTDLQIAPDYLFESSWEVCNKIGGIYTVLSTKANSLQKLYNDRVVFIGPDVVDRAANPLFSEDKKLFSEWCDYARIHQKLNVRIGRWNIPGKPIVFLIRFDSFFEKKNDIYSQMWLDFGVDSLHAYGDYDESSVFAYATGVVIESFYRYHRLEAKHVIAHFNEWQLGMGVLYVKKNLPKVATVFTTHATCIGRSIAGNNLPLYDHLHQYNGDRMARELNMEAKHSIEKTAAQNADCFTTVSHITAQECVRFHHRMPEVTPNGFEKGFIPTGKNYTTKRKEARKALIQNAERLIGHSVCPDALLVGISGRYEFKNKGIDLFIEAMNHLRKMPELSKDIVAFIMVPAWIKGINPIFNSSEEERSADCCRFATHQLHDPYNDNILRFINYLGFYNNEKEHVKIIFIPSYLNGDDGVFNKTYYDLLIGLDVSVFPSYYEPWGYTPHESVAFAIPTITTTLAGFGVWAQKNGDDVSDLSDGIQVVTRTDDNRIESVEEIATLLYDFTLKSKEQIKIYKQNAAKISDKADWGHFILYYQEAYCKALHNSFVRISKPTK